MIRPAAEDGWNCLDLRRVAIAPDKGNAELTKDSAALPPHIEDTVQAIAAVHAKHYQQAVLLQRIVGRVTATIGRPAFAVVLAILVLGWVCANLAVMGMGREPWDPPPFPWLAGAASLVALYTTVSILITQRHDDELARHRELLNLEIAILNEQKSTKIIQMLEQMRQDSPHLADRSDQEAQAMSAPADPQFILNALKDAHKSSGGS
jgi:uncharacterized membrane protein